MAEELKDARHSNPVLAKILNKINKTYEVQKEEVPVLKGIFSTGCIRLDMALNTTGYRIGGLPLGRIIEILGDPGSGKTSISLSCISLYYKEHPEDERPTLILDLERTMTKSFIEGFGIDFENRIIFRRPKTAEEAFATAKELASTGLIAFTLLDSIGAAQNNRQLSRDTGATDVGGISKLMHEVTRELCKICEDNNVTSIFINHITSNPGAGPYANPETSPGGKALGYYASTRLRVRPIKENPKNKGVGIARVGIMKHKTGLPYLTKGTIDFDFEYGKGPNRLRDLVDTAKSLGVLRHSGGQTKIRDSVDTEDWYVPDPSIEKGQAAFFTWIESNLEGQAKLRSIVMNQDFAEITQGEDDD